MKSGLIDVIIVLYNKKISEIKSINNLLICEDISQIIICDNSTLKTDVNKKNYCMNKIKILDMHGNQGLSKAYNAAIKFVQAEYVLILDDDTKVEKKAFSIMTSYLKKKYDVYLPIVKSKHIIMSPCSKGKYRFKAFKSVEAISGKISAINSGMIINSKIFKNIQYNENLFLDMIDHAFMDAVRENNYSICIMKDVIISQNYSRETDNLETAHARFEISKKDNREYYKESILDKIYCEIELFYRKIKFMIHYKTLTILGW